MVRLILPEKMPRSPDFLRECIERHGHSTPFELGKDLFGLAAGPDRVSQDRKAILTLKLQKKHEKRSDTLKGRALQGIL